MKNPLIGKKVVAVFLATDGGAIRFDVEGGESIVAHADGDCCSHSWIEYVETPENLLGTVSAVEDVDLGKEPDTTNYEYCQFYGCKIYTEKGSSLLDYRNESNGYYGGSLVWPGKDSYFYGGVFGQNVSKEDWKRIA